MELGGSVGARKAQRADPYRADVGGEIDALLQEHVLPRLEQGQEMYQRHVAPRIAQGNKMIDQRVMPRIEAGLQQGYDMLPEGGELLNMAQGAGDEILQHILNVPETLQAAGRAAEAGIAEGRGLNNPYQAREPRGVVPPSYSPRAAKRAQRARRSAQGVVEKQAQGAALQSDIQALLEKARSAPTGIEPTQGSVETQEVLGEAERVLKEMRDRRKKRRNRR